MPRGRPVGQVEPIEAGLQVTRDDRSVLRLTFCTPDILRVRLSADGSFAAGGPERHVSLRADRTAVEHEIASEADGITYACEQGRTRDSRVTRPERRCLRRPVIDTDQTTSGSRE